MAKAFEPFHVSHARIFGNRTFTQLAGGDGINRHQQRIIEGTGKVSSKKKAGNKRKVKKDLCPHCATINLIQVDRWTTKCKKCGYEGT